MSEFKFQESDTQGLETLDVISKADRFNSWMYSTIKPFCNGKILEIGSGIGTISRLFVNDNAQITLSDIRQTYCNHLTKILGGESNVGGVYVLDIAHPNFETIYAQHIGQYDTVFALNIIEHVADDLTAVKNCKKLLNSAGSLVVLVPAYQSLYNTFDKELQHYKRYNKEKLRKLLMSNNLLISETFYFNAVGILGWFISGSLLKKKTIPGGQMKCYNRLVPLFKLCDILLFKRLGLSVIGIGKKLEDDKGNVKDAF